MPHRHRYNKNENADDKRGHHEAHSAPVQRPEEKAPVTKWERVKKYVTSEWVTAFLTLVIALLTALQAVIFFKQLHAMRVDERAWIAIDPTPKQWDLTVGHDPYALFSMENKGKTPALDVQGKFFLEILPNDSAPDFITAGHEQISAGAIPPEQPQLIPVFRVSPMSKPDKYIGVPLTQEEKEALDNKRYWFSVHGEVTYSDIFGSKHFVHFCMFDSRDNRPELSATTACSAYNNVDRN